MLESDFNKKIGSIIKLLRERRGCNQEKLGNMLDCTSSKISYMETGKRRISIKEFLMFCSVFCLSPSKILRIIGDENA